MDGLVMNPNQGRFFQLERKMFFLLGKHNFKLYSFFFVNKTGFKSFRIGESFFSLNVEDCMLGIFLPVAGGGECFRSNLKCYFVWSMHLLFWCLNRSLPKIVEATQHEWFEYCELCVTYSYDGCGCFPNHCSFTSILVLDQCLQDNISFFAIYLDIHQKQGDTVILGYSTFSCPLKFVAVAEKADLHA